MPLAKVGVAKLHAAPAVAVTVPICVVPSNILSVSFGTAVPLKVRTVALVTPSPTVPLSGENALIAGVLEGVMVTSDAAEAALVFA